MTEPASSILASAHTDADDDRQRASFLNSDGRRRRRRRNAVHQDGAGWTLFLTADQDEVQAVRGGHWRRRSSSLLVFGMDDWAAPPTSLSDLNPAMQGERLTSLARRASTSTIRRASTAADTTSSRHRSHAFREMVRQQQHPQLEKSRPIPTEPAEAENAEVIADERQVDNKSWVLHAVVVTVMGVGASLPFNAMLALDPGSPLFVAFVTHLFLVLCNLPKVLPDMLRQGGTTLPWIYHAASVVLGFGYNVLRADALTRLPPAVAMTLMNARMLVGMTYDFWVWQTRYSVDQVVSAAVITLGIVWSGISTSTTSSNNATDDDQPQPTVISMATGAAELILGLVLVTVLTTTVKIGFKRYGECPEEQVLFQHLLALPMFYCMPSQWQHIGPRVEAWLGTGSGSRDWVRAGLLLSNLLLSMGHTHALALFTARAPNMLLYQIVDTVKKFVIVVVTALRPAPPWPPMGFWGGSAVLVLGTLRFLSVSQPPQEEGEKESIDDKNRDTKKKK